MNIKLWSFISMCVDVKGDCFLCVLKDERIASERQKTGVCRDSVLKEYIPVSHT